MRTLLKWITPRERAVVLENFLSLSTLQAINYVLPLLVLPYLIRIIGPEKFGLIAFAQALMQYFIIFTDYGFSVSATREISLCGEQKKKVCSVFSAVMTTKIILSLVSLLALVVLINLVPRFAADWRVYLYSFGTVIGNTLFPVWFFQGKEKMKYITWINLSAGLVYAIGIILFVRHPADYLHVPLLNSLYFLISGVLGLHVAFSTFKVEFVFKSGPELTRQLKAGWDIFVSIVAINTYTATRVFAVGLLTNNVVTGYYSIAERIAQVVQTFPLLPFSQALYPRLSKVFARNKQRAAALMHKAQRSTTAAFCVALPVVFVSAGWIVKGVCGAGYPEVVTSLRILLVSVFFIGANAFRVQFLLVSGRADLYARIHLGAALVGLPLIFVLILTFSYLGAAASTIITEAGIFCLTYALLKGPLRKPAYGM